MYRAQVKTHFDVAHFLRGYQGKCEKLHGHRFNVAILVETATLDDVGMSVDFTLLKKHFKEVVGRFDHVNLNETAPFDVVNPTSENLAAYFFQSMKPLISPVKIKRVKVWESPDAWASYSED